MLPRSISKPILLWGLANLFFAFQFILRLSAGILREDIIQKFSIDAATFGTLAGYYYLGYAGTQIPFGIMLDRMNFRLVAFSAIVATSIGTLIFVLADNWRYLLIARLIIGAGSGVAFLSIAKITKTYFAPKYHSLLLGLSFTFGLSGAVLGVAPMRYFFDRFGYYNTFYTITGVGFVIAILTFSLGRTDKNIEIKKDPESVSGQIFKLLMNPIIILIGICGGLMVGALEGFADVWAIAYFKQVYNMSFTESSLVTSFVYIGMCFGGPVLAIASQVIRSTHFMIFITGTLTILVFIILFYSSGLSARSGAALMFFLGILCCYQVLVFTAVSNYVAKSSIGITIALTNCINMAFGHFFHTIIGKLIENNWDGTVNAAGMAVYGKETFVLALSVIPICCFIGQFGFIFLSLKKSRDTSHAHKQ